MTTESIINPRWLRLKDAAVYSAIGVQRLKRLANDGHIIGFQDPESKRSDWIFDRFSLDDYRENQSGYLRQKALELLGKV